VHEIISSVDAGLAAVGCGWLAAAVTKHRVTRLREA